MLFLFYGCVLALFIIFNLLGCCGSSLELHLDITANFDSGATYDDFELYDREVLEDLVENQEQVPVSFATRAEVRHELTLKKEIARLTEKAREL